MRACRPLLVSVLLAGCVPSPVVMPPPQAPSVTPPPPPPAAAPVAWREQPFAGGGWRYVAGTAGGTASFGTAGAVPDLSIRCDAASRRVIVSRAGLGQGAMTLLATSREQAFPATHAGQRTEASIASTDPMLDRFVTSRGRMGVAVGGLPTIVVPTWAEPVRVLEDCRR